MPASVPNPVVPIVVHRVELSPPTVLHALASARVELVFPEGYRIVLNDLRIIRNVEGQLWVGVPSTRSARTTPWSHVVLLNNKLKHAIEDVVIPEFEKWAMKQPSTPSPMTGSGEAQ